MVIPLICAKSFRICVRPEFSALTVNSPFAKITVAGRVTWSAGAIGIAELRSDALIISLCNFDAEVCVWCLAADDDEVCNGAGGSSLGVCIACTKVPDTVQNNTALQQEANITRRRAKDLLSAPKNICNFLSGYHDRFATYIHLILVGMRRSLRRLAR